MRYNLPARTAALARVAELLGVAIDGVTETEAAELSISAVEALCREIGIPERIRDIGGNEAQLPTFAEKAFAIKRLMLLNPRRPTEDELLDILKSAF
jgi:alcohol dehydrogenase class IV